MEQITQEKTFSPSVNHTPSTTWEQAGAGQPLNNRRAASRLFINTFHVIVVLLAIMLTISFSVLILSTLAGLQLGNTLLHPSPFVAYEVVWPGQSIKSLSAYARQTTPLVAYAVSSVPRSSAGWRCCLNGFINQSIAQLVDMLNEQSI